MGWDKGRYYTRSRKVNGRVVREYIGAGRVAQLAAQLDSAERDERAAKAQSVREAKAEIAATEADITAMLEATDLAARAALLAAGFYLHKRGEWRRRREQPDPDDGTDREPPGSDAQGG